MTSKLLVMRDGRKLEVTEYGDRAGHPAFFFHGLIGSHHQASYISAEASRIGLRIIAPNRPGVGRSEFVARKSALDTVGDVEDVATGAAPRSIQPDRDFRGNAVCPGCPFQDGEPGEDGHRDQRDGADAAAGALAPAWICEDESRSRPARGFPPRRDAGLRKRTERFRADPAGLLDRLVTTWSVPDQLVFKRKDVYDLFMQDLHQVFTQGVGPITLAHELALYRNFGLWPRDLPRDKHDHALARPCRQHRAAGHGVQDGA